MRLDNFGNITLIKHPDGTFVKVQIYPTTDLEKKKSVGTVTFEEAEARRFFIGLQAIFENREPPTFLKTIDMRAMKKMNDELQIKKEMTRTVPLTAEEIQRQNLIAEGRLPSEDVAEIKNKKEEGD